MNWLYTVIFSSLVFSGGSGMVPTGTGSIDGNSATAAVRTDETERFDQTYPISSNGRVAVSNVNGSITLEAWDRNEISLNVVKTADSKETLDSVKVIIESKADSFSVSTDYGNWKNNGRNWSNSRRADIQITMKVPSAAILDEIESVNGTIKAAGFTNVSKISAVNGNIQATNFGGSCSLSTVNGEVVADLSILGDKNKLVLSTVNGRISLSIPTNSNATIKAESLNGNISNDFGLPVRKGRYIGRDLFGKIGTGSTTIKLNSVNGELKISHPNDGASPNPVINLLQQKSDDDADWGDDKTNVYRETALELARTNAEIARARTASAKEQAESAVKTARQAAVQVAQMQPMIAKINEEALAEAAESIRGAKIAIPELALAQKEIAFADARMFRNAQRLTRKSNSFNVQGVPNVTINAPGCSVLVRGEDAQVVKYSLTQLSDRRDSNRSLVVEKVSDNTIGLDVQGIDPVNLSRTRIEVTVPRKSNLKIKTDHEIRIDGVSGTMDLIGENESINLRDTNGKLSARSAEGDIRIIGFKGDAEAYSMGGLISLEGDFSKLNVNSVDGEVVVTIDPETSALVETNVDDIRFDGFSNVTEMGSGESRRFKLSGGQIGYFIRSGSNVLVRTPNKIVSEL